VPRPQVARGEPQVALVLRGRRQPCMMSREAASRTLRASSMSVAMA
jgi:hypothetical protein